VRREAEADPRLERLLRSDAGRSRVVVLPHVEPRVLSALYRSARTVLHPSLYEGFGLPLLEAMAAGTPVVTSDLGAMAEIAGPAALRVDPRDSGAIARALRALEDDAGLRERLVAAGRERLTLFDAGAAARATLAVYREARGEGRADARLASPA
jgi:glycosyltransferase involved in cell wall biosynthesis